MMNAPQGLASTTPSPSAAEATPRKTRWRWIGACFAVLFAFFSACVLLLLGGYGDCGWRVSRQSRTVDDLQSLATALKTYQMINGNYPTTNQGLRALVEAPSVEPRPRQWLQLSTELPKDAWGHEFVYVCPGMRNPDGFDLLSKGEDRVEGTADDIAYEPWPRRASTGR